jgi:hypothetical protein
MRWANRSAASKSRNYRHGSVCASSRYAASCCSSAATNTVNGTRCVERNADYRHQNALDYFQFVFGVLLRDLLREKAIHVKKDASTQLRPSPGNIADWWPTGYVLTYFCIGTLKATVHEQCAVEIQPSDALSQPAVWQSFRENMIEEPGLAIAFFDKFMGLEPNWREPTEISNRPAVAERSSKT